MMTLWSGCIHLSRKMQYVENSMYNTSKTLGRMFDVLYIEWLLTSNLFKVHNVEFDVPNV